MTARRMLAGLATGLALAPVGSAHAGGRPPGATAPQPPGTITVMTRNVYLGGDITRPLRAVEGRSGLEALKAFGNANFELRQVVDRTDFPERAKLLAHEILRRKPDLVSLQEVAKWRRGPVEYGKLGIANARRVDYDFLETLLRRLGGRYKAAVVQKASDVEAPAFPGDDPNGPEAFDARLTIRDVILRRRGSPWKVTRRGKDRYDERLDIDVQGVQLSFIRGYGWVDVRAGRKRLRFIATHLEAAFSSIALAQAQELLDGPADVPGKLVLACDCNTRPGDTTAGPGDIAHGAPYDALTEHFTDQWLRFAPHERGLTSPFSETVDEPVLDLRNRIDFVFGRRANGRPMKSVRGWITGTDRRTPGGLWPSDHAGVVMKLRP